MFPSQVSNFINHSMLTKFWELVQLFIISVAFYRVGESTVSVTNSGSVIDEQCKTEATNYENETEVSLKQDENSLFKFGILSIFRVNQWLYCPKQIILPLRSLKSKTRNLDSAQFSNGSEFISSLIVSSGSSGRIMDGKYFFSDMGSSKLEELSPSHSVSSDWPNSGTEESEKKKDFHASYPPSQSPQTTMYSKAPLNAFHLRRYSSGSLFQKDLRGTSKDNLKRAAEERIHWVKRKKEECMGSVAVDSEKDSESETNSAPVGDADAGHDPNEVDKKAGEFIAKLTEQIELQKVASIKRTRRMRMSDKH
ncbi:hypothetical protein P3X46_014590 [Hevea brasiliensis]|uniref:Uncharacterized protein n=1 Tax=Hevea brasiliensis TaxID=3981 RepID=A0ABQ9LUJ5_HEVBR|nr:hypothetical protein P3X46_014590 [Hevea brasiliensis]